MDTLDNHLSFKKSAVALEAIGEGLHAAAYAGVQEPYDALRQAAHHVFKVDLPNTHLVDAPHKAPLDSAAGIAQTIGSAAGMLPWIYASHKIVGAVTPGLELHSEKAFAGRGLNVVRSGLTGSAYNVLFKPAKDDGNYFAEKAADAGIGFTTFATGAGISNTMKPWLGTFEAKAARVTVSAAVGITSGMGAGVMNGELNNLAGREHVNPLRTGIEYGIMGGVLGTRLAGDFKETGKRAMPYEDSHERGPFGENPETLSKNLDAVRAQHGENSPEYANYLIRVGDAHMTQGSIANPEAQANYEQALKILSDSKQSNGLIGNAYDKLANVKESSGDTRGAADDLAKAIEMWKRPESGNSSDISSDYLARRQEHLTHLHRVNEVKYGPIVVPRTSEQ